ncbi:MAG: helix-turn-helix domain-containing protein [Rhodospirillaceae bacterium]|nr:helix-turn-helix domain-containing protein [Rhodospirillaceae bacterium]
MTKGSVPEQTGPQPLSWHMSTAPLAPGQRFEAWRAWNARACDMLPPDDGSTQPSFRMSVWTLADLIVCRSGSTGYRSVRNAGHLRDYRQRWLRLRVMERGHAGGLHGARPDALGPGDIQIIDLADEYRAVYGESDYLTVFVPFDMMSFRAGGPTLPMTLRATSPICRVLADATRSLVAQMPATRAADAGPLAVGFAGLLSGLVPGGAIDEPARAALDRTRRQAIKDHIDNDLARCAPDIGELSRRFGASRSTLYRMFADEGGIQAYALRRRLERAYRDLATRPPTRGIVRAVAEKWGFDDHSRFTRAFRQRFDLAPRDVARLGIAPDGRAVPAGTDDAADRLLSTPSLFLGM